MDSQALEYQSDAFAISRANVARLAYVGRLPMQKKDRDSDAWFTPKVYLNSVRQVIGEIILDPFSSETANKTVAALHFFSEKKSAFENSWAVEKKTTVFMNPPYSAGLCSKAVSRFLEEFSAKSFSEGIVLVNNATDTRWFCALAKECSAICFTDHRISFWNSDQKSVSGNTRGQAFFYFGKRVGTFKRHFIKHGFVMEPLR